MRAAPSRTDILTACNKELAVLHVHLAKATNKRIGKETKGLVIEIRANEKSNEQSTGPSHCMYSVHYKYLCCWPGWTLLCERAARGCDSNLRVSNRLGGKAQFAVCICFYGECVCVAMSPVLSAC